MAEERIRVFDLRQKNGTELMMDKSAPLEKNPIIFEGATVHNDWNFKRYRGVILGFMVPDNANAEEVIHCFLSGSFFHEEEYAGNSGYITSCLKPYREYIASDALIDG